MKKITVITVISLAILGVAAALFAAPSKGNAPVLTPVTVAVQGFHCQPCPDDLQPKLAKMKGVYEVKATLKPAQVTAKLDEGKMTVSQFVTAISSQYTMMNRNETYKGRLVAHIDAAKCAGEETMCQECRTEIPQLLKGIKGVKEVTLDETGKIALMSFDKKAKVTTADITRALGKGKMGYTVNFTAATPAAHAQGDADEQAHGAAACPMTGGGGSCCGN